MFFVGLLVFIIAIIVLGMVLVGTYSALPEGRSQTVTAKYVANFTYLLRKGTFGKIVYWVAPIVILVWFTLYGGILYLIACAVGFHANKKYKLRSSAELKAASQPVGQVGQPGA